MAFFRDIDNDMYDIDDLSYVTEDLIYDGHLRKRVYVAVLNNGRKVIINGGTYDRLKGEGY
ncbi:hypothetical protein [Fusobacterium mortiferum]|uniref:hypothetical protein n=1 Tax=Fusobacterium mortiferum TaxID=850 RepID=UPI003F904690